MARVSKKKESVIIHGGQICHKIVNLTSPMPFYLVEKKGVLWLYSLARFLQCL